MACLKINRVSQPLFNSLKTAAALTFAAAGIFAQAPATRPASGVVDVAAIKPTSPDWHSGAYFTMQGGHRFVIQNYTLKSLVGAAWDNSPPIRSRAALDAPGKTRLNGKTGTMIRRTAVKAGNRMSQLCKTYPI